jgi:hypothetical protein
MESVIGFFRCFLWSLEIDCGYYGVPSHECKCNSCSFMPERPATKCGCPHLWCQDHYGYDNRPSSCYWWPDYMVLRSSIAPYTPNGCRHGRCPITPSYPRTQPPWRPRPTWDPRPTDNWWQSRTPSHWHMWRSTPTSGLEADCGKWGVASDSCKCANCNVRGRPSQRCGCPWPDYCLSVWRPESCRYETPKITDLNLTPARTDSPWRPLPTWDSRPSTNWPEETFRPLDDTTPGPLDHHHGKMM